MRLMDCVKVTILFVMSHYSFAKYYHWGKLSKKCKEYLCLFLTAACEYIIISGKISIRKSRSKW